jgi:hypothetical protein
MTIVHTDRTKPHRVIAWKVLIKIRRVLQPSVPTEHYRTRSIHIPAARALTMEE